MNNKFVIAVYVDNRFGVLTRVTSMFTRRGFNIDTLTVGEIEKCPQAYRVITQIMSRGGDADQFLNARGGEGDVGVAVEPILTILLIIADRVLVVGVLDGHRLHNGFLLVVRAIIEWVNLFRGRYRLR